MNASSPDRTELPPLSDEAVDRVEDAVFRRISAERSQTAAANRTRRRRWLTAGGIAAAFVLGALVSPPLLNGLNGGTVLSSPVIRSDAGERATLPESLIPPGGSEAGSAGSDAASDGALLSSVDGDGTREIVTTATATLRVDDVRRAAEDLRGLATQYGGFIEAMSIGSGPDGTPTPLSTAPTLDVGWISIRVPADQIAATTSALSAHGQVEAISTGASDVTTAAADLRARIDSATASVKRLTDLMAQAGSVTDLLQAEVALTDRQAQLESAQQQLKELETNVTMATLQVTLVGSSAPSADPAGFGDGLGAGWAGLVASANALVAAAGFLIPWVGVALLAGLVVWSAIRLARSRRRTSGDDS